MPSKMVTNRLRLARAVDAAVMPNLDIVNPVLGAFFNPLLEEGETLPDFALVQKLVGRALSAQHGTLIEVDQAHLDELTDDIEPRLNRDNAAQELRRKMYALRNLAKDVYGAERSGILLALEGQPISEVPDVLWRQAQHTLERLEDPDRELPEAVFFGNVLDWSQLAADLRPAVEALGEALQAIAVERRKFDTTRGAKVEAMGRFDTLFSASTRILEGFYLIAEAPHLAERIRPTTIRRRRKVEKEALREGAKKESENEEKEPEKEEEASLTPPPSGVPPTDGESSGPSPS